jgi:hypothetical protein
VAAEAYLRDTSNDNVSHLPRIPALKGGDRYELVNLLHSATDRSRQTGRLFCPISTVASALEGEEGSQSA